MNWILTRSGKRIDLEQPQAIDICLDDISHHLALINRFAGATLCPYSVAQHSLFVADICEQHLGMTDPCGLLAALMHDAHEAYIGDISSPMKRALGDRMSFVEARHERAVQDRYGLRTPTAGYHDTIRRADLMALATEKRDLMPRVGPSWDVLTEIDPVGNVNLLERVGMAWDDWRQAFCDRFHEYNLARVQRAGAMAGQVSESFV